MPIENLIKRENHMRYWKVFFVLSGLFLPLKYVYLFCKNLYQFYGIPIPASYFIEVGVEMFWFGVEYLLPLPL